MHYALLPTRGLLALSGDDAIAFLQGLITGDARKLEKGEAVYAALLSPQGKFLHDFFLVPYEGKILIDCEKPRMDDLRKRLLLYKLRSKITIEALPENIGVAAQWSASGQPSVAAGEWVLVADPRLPELGFRMIGELDKMEAALEEARAIAGDYDQMRLALGVPDGSRDLEIDRAIISHYGFEDLHGVDFTKGCYIGQEVIARTKYRGQLKKFLYRVQAENAVLPPPGTPVYAGEIQIGELHSVSGDMGLAVLRVDDVEKSRGANETLRAGDVALTATLPDWVKHPPQ